MIRQLFVGLLQYQGFNDDSVLFVTLCGRHHLSRYPHSIQFMLKAFYQELQAKTAVQVQTIYTYYAYLAAEDQKVVNSCTVVLPEGGCES